MDHQLMENLALLQYLTTVQVVDPCTFSLYTIFYRCFKNYFQPIFLCNREHKTLIILGPFIIEQNTGVFHKKALRDTRYKMNGNGVPWLDSFINYLIRGIFCNNCADL